MWVLAIFKKVKYSLLKFMGSSWTELPNRGELVAFKALPSSLCYFNSFIFSFYFQKSNIFAYIPILSIDIVVQEPACKF